MDPKASEIPSQSDDEINCITFSPPGPDGCHLVDAGNSGWLRQWNVDTGESVGPWAVNEESIYAVAASTDGRWIVTGDSGRKVIVWNAVTHTIVRQISEHKHFIYAVDVSSDSTRIASGSEDCTVRIFSTMSGVRVILPLEHNAVVGVKFSANGSQVATATRGTLVNIYDAHSGDKLFEIHVLAQVVSITNPLAWSTDDKQLFVASPGKITRFDTSTSCRSEWLIQNNEGNNMPILTHGRFIACAAGSLVSFWDYASCQQIGNVVDHVEPIHSISVSHDGRYLACGHDQGIIVHSLADFLPRSYLRTPHVPAIPLVQLVGVALESWMLGNITNTESILSKEIEIAQHSDPSHHAHTLALRSIIRTRLREWKTAMEDAEMSLQIEQSPIGHISRSFAFVGAGKQEVALDDSDLAFCDCDPSDIALLSVIKSVLIFIHGKHEQAVSRLRYLINAADQNTKDHYIQVLGNMYLKQGDYEKAIQTLKLAKNSSISADSNPLMTISLISDWNFDGLVATAWLRLCESLHASGHIKEVGETLLKMVSSLAEDEKEFAHGRLLEDIVTRSGQVTLLAWTGRSSRCNSCLPRSPVVYSQKPFVPPYPEPAELERRTDELRAVFSLVDALMIFARVTRLQPVRFVHFHLHLPCIVFGVRRLRKEQENVYHAETTGLGDVKFTSTDMLPLKEPQRLVFADPRIHSLEPAGSAPSEDALESDAESNSLDMDNGYRS